MTPHEWRQIQTEVEQLWGRSPKWGSAASLTSRVSAIPFDTAMAVITDLLGDRYVPAPADVIGMSKRRMGTGDTGGRPGQEECAHLRWAIIDGLRFEGRRWLGPDAGSRTGVCTSCLLERRFPAGRLETLGEFEERTGESQIQEWEAY